MTVRLTDLIAGGERGGWVGGIQRAGISCLFFSSQWVWVYLGYCDCVACMCEGKGGGGGEEGEGEGGCT